MLEFWQGSFLRVGGGAELEYNSENKNTTAIVEANTATFEVEQCRTRSQKKLDAATHKGSQSFDSCRFSLRFFRISHLSVCSSQIYDYYSSCKTLN